MVAARNPFNLRQLAEPRLISGLEIFFRTDAVAGITKVLKVQMNRTEASWVNLIISIEKGAAVPGYLTARSRGTRRIFLKSDDILSKRVTMHHDADLSVFYSFINT